MIYGWMGWGYEYGRTMLNPGGLVILLSMAVMLLLVRRNGFVVPFIVVAFFLTELQRFVVLGLDFSLLRILMLVGICRVIIRKPPLNVSLSMLDYALMLYAVSDCIMHTLLYGSIGALVRRLGAMYDLLCGFFLMRLYITTMDDIVNYTRFLGYAAALIAVSMLIENITGRNFFAVFGGIPFESMIRDGRLRSQGAFTHPLLAGAFGATAFPLFAGVWYTNLSRKRIALVGMISCVVIVITCSSSGPIITLVMGICALLMWRWRRYVSVLLSLVGFLGILYAVLKNAPFYRLILRFSVLAGSTSWHRYELIDNFIRRFAEWGLAGVRSTDHWGWAMQDIANQYILVGTTGGFVTLLFFLIVLALAFLSVNGIIKAPFAREKERIFGWSLGCTLLAHAIAFIDVSYNNQMLLQFSILLACICAQATLLARDDEQVPGVVRGISGATG